MWGNHCTKANLKEAVIISFMHDGRWRKKHMLSLQPEGDYNFAGDQTLEEK